MLEKLLNINEMIMMVISYFFVNAIVIKCNIHDKMKFNLAISLSHRLKILSLLLFTILICLYVFIIRTTDMFETKADMNASSIKGY